MVLAIAMLPVICLVLAGIATLRAEGWIIGNPAFGAWDQAHALPPATIIALQDLQSGKQIQLSQDDFTAEPDDFASFEQYNRFVSRQTQLHDLLDAPRLGLLTAGGERQTAEVLERRPFGSFPLAFWYQILLATLTVLFGAGSWAFRPGNAAALFYAISGLGVALIILPAATYGSRQLALPGEQVAAWSWLQQLGTWVFAFGGTSLLTVYPHRILFRHTWILIGLFTALPLIAFSNQWGSIHSTVNIPIVLCYVVFSALAALQWRSTKKSPLDRAGLRWYLTALLVGVAALMATISAPVFITGKSLIPQAYAWTFLVAIYIAVFVGVFRYRIFELEPWFAHIWLWLIFGLLIAMVDSMLIIWIGLDPRPTLLLTLLFMGWLYFPARQWLVQRLMPSWSHTRIDQAIPWLIERALDTEAKSSLDGRMGETLSEWFRPLRVELTDEQGSADVRVHDEGLSLLVPGLNDGAVWRLQYADGGGRLFTKVDVDTGRSIRDLFEAAQRFQAAFSRGVTQERKRLARDLHDDVSGHLLQIVHRAEQPTIENLARHTLNEIRHLVTSLAASDNELKSALAEWRREFVERISSIGGTVQWESDGLSQTTTLSTRQFLNLRSVLREVANNASKHTVRPKLEINWNCDRQFVELAIHCEGKSSQTATATHPDQGFGLGNMKERIEEINGQVQMELRRNAQTVTWTMNLRVPVRRTSN